MDPFLDPNNPQNQAVTTFANNNFGASGVANAQTPATVQAPEQPSGFSVDVPEEIPSDLLTSDVTRDDVQVQRDQLDTQDQAATFTPVETGNFRDPNDLIDDILFGEATEAEQREQAVLDKQAQDTAQFAEDIQTAREEAVRESGINTISDELAETRTNIANIKKRLREDLRRLDTDAELRGVARQFAEGRRQKVISDSRARLADEMIIESAQLGNLEQAQDLIDAAVDARYGVFEIERQARLDELDALGTQITREQANEKNQLEVALADLNEQKENSKLVRSYASEAAVEGAPKELISQVINSNDPDRALELVAPYIGRSDRLYKQLRNAKLTAEYNKLQNELTGEGTGLDADTRLAIGKFAPTQTAMSQMNVAKGMNELIGLIEEYGAFNPTNREGRAKINALRSDLMLQIADANGQGAISDGDRAQYEDLLGQSWGTQNALAGIKTSLSQVNSKVNSNMDLIEATFPGSTGQFEPLREFIVIQETNDYLDRVLGDDIATDEEAIGGYLQGFNTVGAGL